MQRATSVNLEDLKMSACSNFVEHIWKPGSCKNCFCPKASHRLQTSLELGASNVPLHSRNGVRAKPEKIPSEDTCVTASPYTKPTIAVKPTMINSDVSDVWADVNMNADISQVSWQMSPGKHLLMKPGETQRTCLDNFGSSIMREPFVQDALNDCVQHPQGYSMVGLHNLESRVERNISFHSLAFVDEMSGQENRAILANKEKCTLAQRAFCHKSFSFTDRSTMSTMDSTGNPSFQVREGATLPLDSSGNFCSPGFESESGEYCSIMDYCRKSPVPQDTSCPEDKGVWHKSENPATGFWGKQDPAENPREKTRSVKFNEDECRVLNLPSYLQREHHLHDPLQYRVCSERKKSAFKSEAAVVSDNILSSSSSNPLALSQENECYPLIRESDINKGNHLENSSSPQNAQLERQHTHLAEPAHSEPIYAESTKRKKVQLNNSDAHTKTDRPSYSPIKEQADGPWRDGMHRLSNETEDSTTQIAAKITIMAAHAENDKKTIFLSSPDSAVGVQWPCISASFHPDFATPSPTFGYGEGHQASIGMGLGEDSHRFHQQTDSKYLVNESPSVPPKMSRNIQTSSEEMHMPAVSSPVAGLHDSDDHDGPSTQLSSRNSTDTSVLEALPSFCSYINGMSAEELSRGLPVSSYERRHKNTVAAWSRQCRIEEEEEEEQELLNYPQARDMDNGPASAPSNVTAHQMEDCSLQENNPGMCKSASFAFDFPSDKKEIEEFVPPPPPPKKQSRHAMKMNKSNPELETVSNGSAESLGPSFRGIQVNFTAGSSDSLNSDTRSASDGDLVWSMYNMQLHPKSSPQHTSSMLYLQQEPLLSSSKNREAFSLLFPNEAHEKNYRKLIKICKTQESKAAASYCSPSVPVHFNIQQDCGHFVASVPSSMLLSPEVVKGTSPDSPRPCRSASEHDCVVVITREVPHQTAASLVRDSTAYHKAKPELYERRICFLLLQLCNGLEHLKDHGIIHRDLCLENLLLVHCKSPTSCNKTKDEKHLPRLIISNFLKAKQKPGQVDSKIKKNQARLAPEIVSASQYKKFDEFQTGILIYELLHQPNPFEVRACLREQEYSQDDLPLLPNISIYSRGLQQLAHLLLEADPIKRIRITEAKRMLQCLLWGPRKDLIDQPLNHEEALHSALQNWIDMKRALLMMKFAERAVDTERSIELEDWLCCQYLASAEPVALFNTLKLLQLL
ncbi:tyrosine-protein kinase PRAG1 isoform X2 [Alligator sinensis]|uniref:Inactive tyrosine-protein kinase PRAG1 n=1 Tax=Alligator sinensis TaxID=38654 RepID=A0A3Q0FM06_ALLSI|nr:tyrosine-protein kinase PRAG1 isoform X2 [Alligator sinensis]